MEDAYIVYIAIICLIVLLYTEIFRPAMSFLFIGVLLVVTGVLSSKELLMGFANEQLAVILMLLVISNMISNAGVTDRLFAFLSSDKPSSHRAFSLKMMGGVGISSAIFNNTPLVAIVMPYVTKWCKRNNFSPSKLLIPLSFASILGGCITLIGTSTNLIVNGLAMESGMPSLGIFDFTIVGVVMMIIGVAYLFFLGPKILPERASLKNENYLSERKYFVETHIKPDSPIVNKTVEEASLRNLTGIFLVEIIRQDQSLLPVSPKEVLLEGDILMFAGDLNAIADLGNPQLGLSLPTVGTLTADRSELLVEVVVAPNSRLISKKIKDSDFRGRYDGAIVAVHRNGERMSGKIGEIEIKAGDLLLVMAGNDFFTRTINNPGFYVLNRPEEEINHVPLWKPLVLISGLIVAIILSFFHISLFQSLLVVMSVGVLLKIASPTNIRNSVDYNLLLIIALGLALGKAMMISGATDHIIQWSGIDGSFQPIWILLILFSVTNLLASFITSKAAVAITLPLALQIVADGNFNPVPFILIVAFGGAANFMTPIGYQTNLMVFGPGRYSFRDFMKIGLPLTVIYAGVSSFILAKLYDLI